MVATIERWKVNVPTLHIEIKYTYIPILTYMIGCSFSSPRIMTESGRFEELQLNLKKHVYGEVLG